MSLHIGNKKDGFMKVFSILFLSVFFTVFSCTPISLDDKKRGVDRGVGERNFNVPGLKNISLDELRKKTLDRENCFNYQPCPGFSLLGKLSPSRPLQNCVCKALDEGLKPLCEEEAAAKELLKQYQNRRDRKGAEDVEEYLAELEIVKYEFVDEIYGIADEFDELEETALDEIEDRGKYDVTNILMRLGVKSELGSFTRTLDSKARTACRGQLDLSKIKTRGRR